MKTLSSYDFKNKLVLVRSDLNSDVKNGNVLESERIRASSETIKELKKKGARVVVLAHQGRKGNKDYTSLEQHARLLNKFVNVKFVEDVVGVKARREILNLKGGEVLLLDNVRGVDDEMKPDKKNNSLVKFVKEMNFEIYVNDAFSVSHRAQTSVVLLPRVVEKVAIGRLMERELKALEKISLKDTLYVLAGAKAEDNIKLMEDGRKIVVGGLFGQLCLIASGKDLGFMNKYFDKSGDMKYVPELKKKLKKCDVILPVDYAVKENGKRKEYSLSDFPLDKEIYDIGKKTQDLFVSEIAKAKSLYMKGPVGYSEDKKFAEGTEKVLKAVAKMKKRGGFSLIGGGHLSSAIERSKISEKNFGYVSLSGGALISYLAGEKLIGVEVLKNNRPKNYKNFNHLEFLWK